MNSTCFKCKKTLPSSSRYGLHISCFEEWFGANTEFRDVVPKSSESKTPNEKKELAFEKFNSSFFHGKFKKYSAELGNESYILKVQMPEYPELPFTEFLCNQLAEAVEIEVPPFYLISFDGVPAFLSRNFMSKTRPENLIHIYRYLPEKCRFDCESLMNVIARETEHVRDIERFLEICLFDSLIGNHDRHGRNLALLQTTEKKILAPFYDNPSYIGIESDEMLGAHLNPRGAVATSKTGEPLLEDYAVEIGRLGYENVTKSFLKKIDVLALEALIDESFLSAKRKVAMKRLLVERYKNLIRVLAEGSHL